VTQLEFIIRAEQDPEGMTPREWIDGCAGLIRTCMVTHLLGSGQRAVYALVEGGILNDRGDVIAYPEGT
jgi:hypothetical protein